MRRLQPSARDECQDLRTGPVEGKPPAVMPGDHFRAIIKKQLTKKKTPKKKKKKKKKKKTTRHKKNKRAGPRIGAGVQALSRTTADGPKKTPLSHICRRSGPAPPPGPCPRGSASMSKLPLVKMRAWRHPTPSAWRPPSVDANAPACARKRRRPLHWENALAVVHFIYKIEVREWWVGWAIRGVSNARYAKGYGASHTASNALSWLQATRRRTVHAEPATAWARRLANAQNPGMCGACRLAQPLIRALTNIKPLAACRDGFDASS